MSRANDLTVQKQFKMDCREDNYKTLVEEQQKAYEEEAQRELDDRMGKTLADYMMLPSWVVEDAETPHIHIHTLTMKILFKP